MSSNGGVPSSTGEVLAFSEWNVFALGVLVALGESKIDDVDVVLGALCAANKEVVGFNITMDDPLLVHLLNSLDLQVNLN